MASILAEIDASMARTAAAESADAAARPAPMPVDSDMAAPAIEPAVKRGPTAETALREAESRSRLHWFIGTSDTTSSDPGSLTYEPFFGLHEKPFSLSSDPRFFFGHGSHGTAFDTLGAGIRRREGLLVLTGEVGTGKTTLCRAVLQSLDQKTFAALVPDPFLSREDLLKTLLVDFGVVSLDDVRSGRLRGASRADLSYPLYEFLASLQPLKAFAVVMIDEAQNLTAELLEEIRILSDLDNGQKLLEVVLVGQPELQARLATAEMRQINQRVSVRCELTPLVREDVSRYVSHRLTVAGNAGSVRFSEAALDRIWTASNGIPRLINLIGDRALASACRARTFKVELEHVSWAIDDLRLPAAGSLQQPAPAPARAPRPVAPPVIADSDGDPFKSFLRESGIAPAAPEDQPANPVGLALGRRRPLIGLPSAAASSQAADASVTPLPPKVETIAARAPAFEASLASTRRRRAAWLVPAAACVVLLAGLGSYWYAVTPPAPRQQPAPAVKPAPAPASVETAPAAAINPPAPELPAQGATSPAFAIRMATFRSSAGTEQALQELRAAGYHAYSVEVMLRDGSRAFAVFLGPYSERAAAERDRDRAQQVPGYGAGFIVQAAPATRPPGAQ